MTTKDTTFKDTPLITPERLRDDLHGSFVIRPKWADTFILVGADEADISLPKAILLPPSDKDPIESYFTIIQAAAMLEATRYGHRVEVNSNGQGGDYTKVVFTGLKHDGSNAREDNVTTARVFEGAGGANRVHRNRLRPKDQTTGLKTTGAVSDGSDRAKVIIHAARVSREADRTEEQTYQYIGNLMRLFDMHDAHRKDEGAV